MYGVCETLSGYCVYCRVLHRLDKLVKCETLSGYCVYCRVLHRLDKLVKSVTAEAVDVTQVVCSAQNVVRRKFVSDLKRSMSDVLQVKKDWQQLIVQLTHQRSVSFSSLSLHHYCTSVTHASHLPLLPNT